MKAIRLFRLEGGKRPDPAVDEWFEAPPPELRSIAQKWFEVMRACGADVAELLHDGHPTACVGDLAFGYVNAFKDHVNVGFFLGAILPDPSNLLEGDGRFMRHVKLRTELPADEAALRTLIIAAYADMKARLTENRPESRIGANNA
jgi:uncharacterized protein DUF1801